MTLVIIGSIVLLALLGTPLFAVIGLAELLAFHTAGIDPSAIFIELYRITASPTLIAIPLFTFAGFILANGKTPKRTFYWSTFCLFLAKKFHIGGDFKKNSVF